MADEKAYEKGLEVRRTLWGEAGVERLKNYEEVDKELARLIVEYPFGNVWGRPGLDLKSRSMCTVAVLTALARGPELAIHIKGALNQGITQKEVLEILIHVGVYAGLPTTVEAIRVAKEVFKENS